MGISLKVLLATLGATAATAAFAGVAAAATPQQIYNDLADNGRLDHTYSKADIARYQHDATVAGYGNQVIKIMVKPKTKPKLKPLAKQVVKPKKQMPKQHFKPVTKQVVTPPKKTPPQVFTPPSKSALPFTGSNLAIYVAIGFALIAGGVLLRVFTGRRSSDR